MKLTDFLGKEYGPGDLVVYGAMSGRSVNVVVGRVVDIYRVYYGGNYKWQRLDDDAPVPRKTNWKEEDIGECDSATRVKVQPLRAARWKQHHGRTRYVDTRTGKGIDPDRGKGLPHVLKESHFVFGDGIEYDYEGEQEAYESRRRAPGMYRPWDQVFRQRFHVNYGEPGTYRHKLTEDVAGKPQLWWVSRTYQPWVEKREEGPEPVTLEITDNIVKWEGVLDGEEGAESG